jgi:hypothetical protein
MMGRKDFNQATILAVTAGTDTWRRPLLRELQPHQSRRPLDSRPQRLVGRPSIAGGQNGAVSPNEEEIDYAIVGMVLSP